MLDIIVSAIIALVALKIVSIFFSRDGVGGLASETLRGVDVLSKTANKQLKSTIDQMENELSDPKPTKK